MLNKEQIQNLVTESLEDRPDLFVVDIQVSSGNDIIVLIDGDNGASLKDITKVSRAIEGNLDREIEDFALEVGTPGVDYPLSTERQFRKNIGRIVQLSSNNETYKGRISEVNNNTITLTWKAREPKPIGKGKVTVEKNEIIEINQILNAKVQVEF